MASLSASERPLLVGEKIRLRALESEDIDILYSWENDPKVWPVSETLAPFSRAVLRQFIEDQQYDIYRTRQLRLVICSTGAGVSSEITPPIGFVDLFDFDPVNLRVGVGILIYDEADRRRGYASEALDLVCDYARQVLGLHQLYAGVESDNFPSFELFFGKGFAKIGVRREWFRRIDGWKDEILLQKVL